MRPTFGGDEAAVIPNWTAVFKYKDCNGHHGQTHDEHHHPDCWTVRFCRENEAFSKDGINPLTVHFQCFDS